jgi:heme-degrading monooxygenase HmoA
VAAAKIGHHGPMIRSVMMLKFKPESTDDQIEAFAAALGALPFPGRVHFEFHRDMRLTDDTMDAVVIADFLDEPAYRAWIDDPGHHHVRSTYLDPIRGRRERVLFEV